jgi:hypothetical protein
MAKLMLNYAHAPKVNYLYIMNNDFIGFVEKLSKQEKEILKAKLIWKRKNKKEEPKQDRTCTNNCSVVCGECQIFEPKQETLTYTEAAKKEERIFNSTMMSKQEIKLEDIFNYEKRRGVKDMIDAHKEEKIKETNKNK